MLDELYKLYGSLIIQAKVLNQKIAETEAKIARIINGEQNKPKKCDGEGKCSSEKK